MSLKPPITVAIHQPEYFPWLGFVEKARAADVLVLLDTVQFDRTSLQHRCKVLGPNGLIWLTIPFVHRFPQRIDEVEIAEDRWRAKHWKSLQACYGRAAGYPDASLALSAYFDRNDFRRLVDATVSSVAMLLQAFAVRGTRVVRASELAARGEKSDLVLAICQELGARRYLSGRTGATYLDSASFAAAGIEIHVQSFKPPIYPRHRGGGEVEPGLSALDAWLNLGRRAPQIAEHARLDP